MRYPVMAALALALSGSLGSASGAEEPRLRFQYMTHDGGVYLDCEHVLRDAALRDWDVKCGEGRKRFTVHFHVREYTRPVYPARTLEVAYYLTQLEEGRPSAHSSQGVWIELEKESPLAGLAFHQSVENDAASLVLRYFPTPVR